VTFFFDCAICLESIGSHDAFISACSDTTHHICKACAHDYVVSKVNERHIRDIVCPGVGCHEALGARVADMMQTAAPEVQERYRRWKMLDDTPRASECPSCKHIWSRPLVNNSPKLACPSCTQPYCRDHALAHPATESCSKYMRAETESASHAELAATSVACPGWVCKARITKIEGCNHMICSHCHVHFCFACGDRYWNGWHYHYWWMLGCHGHLSTPVRANELRRWYKSWLRPLWLLVVLPILFITSVSLALVMCVLWLSWLVVQVIVLPLLFILCYCGALVSMLPILGVFAWMKLVDTWRYNDSYDYDLRDNICNIFDALFHMPITFFRAWKHFVHVWPTSN
jgi:hypothetical protein